MGSLLNKVLNSNSPTQIVSELNKNLLLVESDPKALDKCETLLNALSNSTSMYKIFKGNKEDLTVATNVLTKCCSITSKQSMLDVLDPELNPPTISEEMFQEKALAYIKTYTQEIIMNYANQLQAIQKNEKPSAEEDESKKRLRESKLA